MPSKEFFIGRLLELKEGELWNAGWRMVVAAQRREGAPEAYPMWCRGHSLINKAMRMRAFMAGKDPRRVEMDPLLRDL